MEIINSVQKAAIIMMSLEESTATEVLKHLDPEQVRIITDEISKMGTISASTADNVINEFCGMIDGVTLIGGRERARQMMRQAKGEDEEVVAEKEDKEALQILRDADPFALLEVIRNDQPQTIALVLRYLSPVKASRILRDLSPELRNEVVKRLTELEHPPMEVVEGIAKILKPRET